MESAEITDALRNSLLALLPRLTSVAVQMIGEDKIPLFPEESSVAAAMSPSRFREFAAGRACAREALAGLGIGAATIAVGAGRAPVWPAGVVGSIAHTRTVAVAVTSAAGRLRSIGVDVEDVDPLEADLLDTVCHPAEIAALGSRAGSLTMAKVLFSAKESIFKCLWPIAGIFIEFPQMEVRLDAARATFVATSHGPAVTIGPARELRGIYATVGRFIVTAAWLERDRYDRGKN